MTKMTIAQVRAELDRERTARIYQETEIAQLRHTVETLRAEANYSSEVVRELQKQIVAITSVASAVNTMQTGQRGVYVMPQWQKDRAAAMAAAKAHALRSGTSVAVSSFL